MSLKKSLDVLILAAGRGKRMHSDLPKVLHRLGGKPLLQHIVETAYCLNPQNIYVVYGNGGSQVPDTLGELSVTWIKQKEVLGTGHAVLQALPQLTHDDQQVLILLGDTPLVQPETLKKLIANTKSDEIGLITLTTPCPSGLGRILRDARRTVVKIIEEKEATDEERKINEVNSGVFYVPINLLKEFLPYLKRANTQSEYYLTDIIDMAAKANVKVVTISSDMEGEMQGVNDPGQLAKLERFYQKSQAELLLSQGVTLYDPNRFDIRGRLTAGKNVVIDINVIFEGENVIKDNCFIGPNTTLKNVEIGNGVKIHGYCLIEDAVIGDNCTVGPFAHIRPGTKLKNNVRIGNFVEIKNSQIESETKINHLSYIGDAKIGKKVNVGAGTITCNYDGFIKHPTIVEDEVFIGSNTALIAPICVKRNATIGAGSILSKEVPADNLTLTRAKRRTLTNWKRRKE